MKKSEIRVGGHYRAKVSGRLVTVVVNSIGSKESRGRLVTSYSVTNLSTGRKLTFRSAAKFRLEAEKSSDPILLPELAIGGLITQEIPVSSLTTTILPEKSAGVKPVGLAAVLSEEDSPSASSPPHVIVEARAGTGKTTTLVEGLKRVKGIPSNLVPSPQQEKVWEAMEQSKGAKTVCFVAFNKSIATELQARVPKGCDAMTMHSMGFRAVTKAFGRLEVSQFRVQDILARLLGIDARDLKRDRFELMQAVEKLVGLCKQTLTSPRNGSSWEDELDYLSSYYEVDLNGFGKEIFDLVPKVLDSCKDVKGSIDYNDMIWLPIALYLPLFQYDLLLVDEAQDLNRCQQGLARRAGKRLILCGDPRQAIYGFAGADADSMPRMARELGEDFRGCVTLPLTITRRCGKAIVREANMIVQDLDAFETNPEGTISRAVYPKRGMVDGDYLSSVQDGNMLLCRVNAPLVSQCFRLLRMGKKANIQGRDIGAGLISTIRKLKCDKAIELVAKLSDWLSRETSKENAKRNPSEAKLIALQDRYDCIICFTEGVDMVEEVVAKIESIFTDDKDCKGIRLSSIHKAKGLEAKKVYLLEPKGASVPHPMARSEWQRGQEMNLRYVAITRAIEELVYVS